jgi:hypothetical protein
MGILDSKSRVMDAITTVEGRRQLAAGTFEVSYVTFTDAGVSYESDAVDGHVDPTGRIYLEAASLPQDQIVFEANDEGYLNPVREYQASGSFLSSSMGRASLANGRLFVYEVHHGRTVKVDDIRQVTSDSGKGFVYSDTTGLTGSILIDPTSRGGNVSGGGPPWIARVGTRGGLDGSQFARSIVSAVNSLKTLGGPNVVVSCVGRRVYFDTGEVYAQTFIRTTGSLSTPMQVTQGSMGGSIVGEEVEEANFSSQITGILTSSFDNFSDLQTISTVNRTFRDDAFELSTNRLEFDLTSIPRDLSTSINRAPSLNSVDSLFSDKRASRLENFMYLPPILKTSDSLAPNKRDVTSLRARRLGSYPSWGDNEKPASYSQIMRRNARLPHKEVVFTRSSRANNVMLQFFEVSGNSVSKLDVLRFGRGQDSLDPGDVYFIGKVYQDGRGTTCFLSIFTVVFTRPRAGSLHDGDGR